MKISTGTLICCQDISEKRLACYQQIGLNVLQIAGVDERYLAPGEEAAKRSGELFALLKKYSFEVPCMFLSYPEQDWANPCETVGLTPEKFRSERMILSCRQMLWAKQYGIRYISCHVGFFPEKGSGAYDKIVKEMRQLVLFAEFNGLKFLFETGMESALVLKEFFTDIEPAQPGINFDPANLLIYDQDDPEAFLDVLEDRVEVVHCKDAVRPQAGSRRGKETVLGEGETNFSKLLVRLLKNGFSGYPVIERELPPGPEQECDIANAVKLIKQIYLENKND